MLSREGVCYCLISKPYQFSDYGLIGGCSCPWFLAVLLHFSPSTCQPSASSRAQALTRLRSCLQSWALQTLSVLSPLDLLPTVKWCPRQIFLPLHSFVWVCDFCLTSLYKTRLTRELRVRRCSSERGGATGDRPRERERPGRDI